MKKHLFFLSAFICCLSSYASDAYFEHIGVLDGLSQISVLSIYQDKLGYMWFGTREGLNRYDGSHIEIILSKENDEFGLTSNIIDYICGHEDELFIHCGYHQLVAYNIKEESFTLIDNSCQQVTKGVNNVWISSRNHIKRFNYTGRVISDYYSLPDNTQISFLFESANKKLYVGTENGLYIIDENRTYQYLLPDNVISNIFEDSKHNIWVGTNGNGVYKISRNGLTEHYTSKQNNPLYKLSNDVIRGFCEDNFGRIWIASFDGLNRMVPERGEVVIYRNTSNNPTELSHNSIHTLYKDKQGTIWIGTYFGGVNYYNPEFNIYTYYYPDEGNPGNINFPIVGKMTQDSDNNLWICTEGGGLNFYDRENKTFRHYKACGGNSISHNNLKCIWYNDKNNKLYIGTHMGGLNIYDIRKNTFTHYTTSNNEIIPNDIIENIFPFGNKLVILTQKGIVQLDLETEKMEAFFDNPHIEEETGYALTNLFIDSNLNLWLAQTGGGLLRYNLRLKNLKEFSYSPHNEGSIGKHPVSNIYETSEGKLFFATLGSGLFEYNPERETFVRYSQENDELLSNFVYLLTETNQNYLLVLSGNGINFLDKDRRSVYIVNREHGFPLEKINFECGACVTKDGEIFIGGTNGMASFSENQTNFISKDYDLFFSDIYINNELQQVTDKSVLPLALPYLNNIKLKHNQTNILIRFATSNHVKLNKVPFEYKLDGVNDLWLPVTDQQIGYSNLSPGKYTLHVRERLAGTDQGSPKEISLAIKVVPPFYASALAFIFYFIVICVVIWLVIRVNKKQFQLKTSLEYEIRENNRIQELNQMKLQFFTNISHEFRTPLALIIGQIESLMDSDNLQSALNNKLAKIHKNASHLRSLVSELLDFRKQERDMLQLRVSEINIVEFAQNVFNSFKELAAKKQIDYTFFSAESKIMIWFDPLQLQKVFYNLLSNAFKYSEEHTSIQMKIERKQPNQVSISIIDSGIGIAEEDLPRIFDRFYQDRTMEAAYNPGTGIGLALAKGVIDLHHGTITAHNNKDKGCTFRINLLTGSEHFTPEEKESGKESDWKFFKESAFPQQEFFEEIKSTQIRDHALSSEITILIVEDDEEVLDFLDEIFSPIYHVVTAKDGYEGLEKIKTLQPDIVLSDIMMPKMSGKEMCIKIKSNFETSHIPVILLRPIPQKNKTWTALWREPMIISQNRLM